ncbi:MAG: hypothetical protein ACTSV7_06825 [Candidatus Baldrarchaeia archaeon]
MRCKKCGSEMQKIEAKSKDGSTKLTLYICKECAERKKQELLRRAKKGGNT